VKTRIVAAAAAGSPCRLPIQEPCHYKYAKNGGSFVKSVKKEIPCFPISITMGCGRRRSEALGCLPGVVRQKPALHTTRRMKPGR